MLGTSVSWGSNQQVGRVVCPTNVWHFKHEIILGYSYLRLKKAAAVGMLYSIHRVGFPSCPNHFNLTLSRRVCEARYDTDPEHVCISVKGWSEAFICAPAVHDCLAATCAPWAVVTIWGWTVSKLFLFPLLFWNFPLHFHWSLICVCMCLLPDEVYAQKLKGKALSEELDLALNDMTTL